MRRAGDRARRGGDGHDLRGRSLPGHEGTRPGDRAVCRRQIIRCVLRPAAPTVTRTAMLRSSWNADPLASCQLENASDTPTSAAAAGMVVTEMNTPMRALALASVRDTTPTSPARMATMTEYMLGVSMRSETGLVPDRNEAGA